MSKADQIYDQIEQKIKSDKGKIIAIDEESGDYFIADDELQAYHKALKKHPNKTFVFKRIGFTHTYFVGAF